MNIWQDGQCVAVLEPDLAPFFGLRMDDSIEQHQATVGERNVMEFRYFPGRGVIWNINVNGVAHGSSGQQFRKVSPQFKCYAHE